MSQIKLSMWCTTLRSLWKNRKLWDEMDENMI